MRNVLRTFTYVALVAWALPTAAAASGTGPAFAEGPKAARGPGGVRITFAVEAPTDVEVAVLGPDGAVRRHLAAGRLGPDAPPPLQADSLRQSLRWDGTDDAGRPVADFAACRLRVGLGLRGRLHRIIGWNPQQVEAVRGITCGPDATLYVLYGGGLYAHRTTTLIAAFDRQARYRRQVFPGPASLPEAKRPGWPHVRTDDGRQVPANLYVADYGNDRVAVFSPDGALLDEIPVARPDTVRVSRRMGAVYVMTIEAHPKDIHHQHYYVAAHNWRPEAVLKFASRKARKAVWRFDVPRKPGTYGGAGRTWPSMRRPARPSCGWPASGTTTPDGRNCSTAGATLRISATCLPLASRPGRRRSDSSAT